jgi:hypothetical protein
MWGGQPAGHPLFVIAAGGELLDNSHSG